MKTSHVSFPGSDSTPHSPKLMAVRAEGAIPDPRITDVADGVLNVK
jgi:hypothetical protein